MSLLMINKKPRSLYICLKDIDIGSTFILCRSGDKYIKGKTIYRKNSLDQFKSTRRVVVKQLTGKITIGNTLSEQCKVKMVVNDAGS
jgi:hypothetical protein